MPAEQAAQQILIHPFQDAGGFAKVDLHRRVRCGFPEVVFGQGKTAAQIEAILKTLLEHEQGGLVTRLDPEAAAASRERCFPTASTTRWPARSGCAPTRRRAPKLGRVVIVTAGTSDLPVAEEARVTAEAWNCDVSLVADVGVAGLHRLLHQLPQLKTADALVVVAGMEGALPSVVGGLVDCPVIAVPTSIGYGAHFHGVAALLGMLNSCASNVVVVNIDAGFSGGHVASLIARRMGQARQTAAARPTPSSRAHSAPFDLGSVMDYPLFMIRRGRSPRHCDRSKPPMALEPIETIPTLPPRPRDSHKGRFGFVLVDRRFARDGRRRRALRGLGPAIRCRAGPSRQPRRGSTDRRQLRAFLHDLSACPKTTMA